jgi:putative ATPase
VSRESICYNALMGSSALKHNTSRNKESPLAHRMRPRHLEEFIGQEHILAPGRLLRRAIEADQLSSLIFHGPPGTGKTTLAMVIANTTHSHFITINAVLAGVKQIREAIDTALELRTKQGRRTTLFVDEVHRWNKAQQDALLPHVENGTIILIGATTENPYFEVNKALVSRSRIFQLKPLNGDDLSRIARHALATPERGYGHLAVEIDADALTHLVNTANGDARGVLNALELAVETTATDGSGIIHITLTVAEESIQQKAVLYDKDGDAHYDTISAFIKSIRGSDPDAALYWLAKMDYAGEDPRFLMRRMAILASEDIGLADPHAVSVVINCWQSFERLGLPEGRFPLAQAALYLATAPKSNSTMAFFDAKKAVQTEIADEVPTHLKDGNRDAEGFGHGKGYLYPHAYRDHWVAQQYLPDALQGKLFYQPSDQGYEKQLQDEVARRREAQLAAMLEGTGAASGLGEIYSTSPPDRGREQWLERTIGTSGQTLSMQRDTLFKMAAIRRHHVVLVIGDDGGLLTWEAVRHTPEGGVWVVTADAQAAENLGRQSTHLAELDRPRVLVGALSKLDGLLAEQLPDKLLFDHIISRNPYPAGLCEEPILRLLHARLQVGGQVTFAQPVSRHGQRLYRLVDWAGAEALGTLVAAAEEQIYNATDDPLVNWDEDEIIHRLNTVFTVQSRQLLAIPQKQRITSQLVARWFSPATGERPSYQDRLRQFGLSDEQCAETAARYRRQLQDRVVDWQTSVFFARATPRIDH